jgi:hypothetical protein
MIEFLIFVAIVTLVWRQFTGARNAKWRRRGAEWYAPMGRMLVSDARVTALAIAAPFRHRRAVQGADLDGEWRDWQTQ